MGKRVQARQAVQRPDPDEALESIRERVEYAICLAAEAYSTPDGEDENGKLDPIFAYTESVIADTVPLAVLGVFMMLARTQNTPDSQRGGA